MRFRFIEEHRSAFQPAIVHVYGVSTRGCGRSAVAQPAAGSGLIWSRWRTSKNNRVSAWAAMVGHE